MTKHEQLLISKHCLTHFSHHAIFIAILTSLKAHDQLKIEIRAEFEHCHRR
jgi:hypothetical protein